jgi:hypothetical protein
MQVRRGAFWQGKLGQLCVDHLTLLRECDQSRSDGGVVGVRVQLFLVRNVFHEA